jgi:pimeloyl-ACP methyl ester carboxylesterase
MILDFLYANSGFADFPRNVSTANYEGRLYTPDELLQHNFRVERPTKIISHGWTSNALGFCKDYVAAYFTHPSPSYNVIGIDYAPLATWDNYFMAAENAIRVGDYSGEHLGNLLINQLGQRPDQIHAIGHSLGGHLVGHFGRSVESAVGQGKIARVTALDPAGPYFDVQPAEKRVMKTDAEFVDVIHTNSGSILSLCLSYKGALGHVDFYPNGGSHQAGCTDICLASYCNEWNLIDLFNGACSHGRVNDLYVESILHAPHTDVFLSKSCDSWDHFENDDCHDDIQPIEMGEGLTKDQVSRLINQRQDVAKTFFLTTNDKTPYSGVQLP